MHELFCSASFEEAIYEVLSGILYNLDSISNTLDVILVALVIYAVCFLVLSIRKDKRESI